MKVALGWAGGIGSLAALEALGRAHDVTLVHVAGDPRAAPDFVIGEQAAALGLPLVVERPRAGEPETEALARALASFSPDGIAFGYLRGEDYAGMFKVARAARGAGAEPLLPVRHVRPDEAARSLAERGDRLFVRAVDAPLPREWLGAFLDPATVDGIEGSHGRQAWSQLRTLAVDGPRFRRRVEATAGDIVPAGGGEGWRLEIGLKGC